MFLFYLSITYIVNISQVNILCWIWVLLYIIDMSKMVKTIAILHQTKNKQSEFIRLYDALVVPFMTVWKHGDTK